ncbi:unnamed protein product [Prorocentrum cordatum]|uniref:Uncharacterized protein n=1 Tax=Prorocentrum cordatum TaxID=2364126 RepID=A0ABN9X901_9DINO|nr:unnamed protein product [Polarella glacialis]
MLSRRRGVWATAAAAATAAAPRAQNGALTVLMVDWRPRITGRWLGLPGCQDDDLRYLVAAMALYVSCAVLMYWSYARAVLADPGVVEPEQELDLWLGPLSLLRLPSDFSHALSLSVFPAALGLLLTRQASHGRGEPWPVQRRSGKLSSTYAHESPVFYHSSHP